jgi:pyrimidine operon attenuation protein / uracil phosphoribosyltransferase
MSGRVVMDHLAVSRAIRRMASEIAEDLRGVEDAALVGIHTGGVPLCERLAAALNRQEGVRPPVGEMDITLYRDDIYTGLERPEVGPTRLPFDVNGARIVLVDDVLFTGRTVRAALDQLMDFGRPKAIWLAVLVDRGHRELPIAARNVGRRFETELTDRVVVSVNGEGPNPSDLVQLVTGEGAAR